MTLTRKKDEAFVDKTAGIAGASIKIDHIHWYVPHRTPSIQQHGVISKQILSKTPTELRYIERSVFMKEESFQSLCNFEMGSQESNKVRMWIILAFQQRDRQDSQNLNIDTFCRLPGTSCQCKIGTEKHPDNSILLNYDDDDNSQGCPQIKEPFRALTKVDILQPYISDHDFRSSNVRADDIGYNLYVF